MMAWAMVAMALGAAQSVFVMPDNAGTAWWLKPMQARPMQTAVGPHSLDAINAYRRDTAIDPDEICWVEALSPDAIIALSRADQREIDDTMTRYGSGLFVRSLSLPDGSRRTVHSAMMETCNGQKVSALVIGDDRTGAIDRIIDGPDGRPAFLTDSADGLFDYGFCLECDDRTSVHYDAAGKRFYELYVGN